MVEASRKSVQTICRPASPYFQQSSWILSQNVVCRFHQKLLNILRKRRKLLLGLMNISLHAGFKSFAKSQPAGMIPAKTCHCLRLKDFEKSLAEFFKHIAPGNLAARGLWVNSGWSTSPEAFQRQRPVSCHD